MDQVGEIRSKVDIVGLISEYVQLKKAGRNFKGLCPFHAEKTPSFMVNPELQIYKCFGCNEGGDCYSFLQKIEGIEFGEALRLLAKRAGVTLTGYRPTGVEEMREKLVRINALAGEAYHFVLTKHPVGKKAREYLEQRGLGEEEIKKYELGFSPAGWDFLVKYLGERKGIKLEELERAGLLVKAKRSDGKTSYYDRFRERIMFPLKNSRGQTVGFSGRVLPGADEKAGGKYVNTPETEIYHKGELLYGLDITRSEIKRENLAVVVEGEIDAIASYKAGVKNVVAIKGSALTRRQAELLRRISETVVLALDADLAGDAAARRGAETAEEMGLTVKVARMRGVKDPGELAIESPGKWRKLVAEATGLYDFYLQSAVERHGLDAAGKRKIGGELLPLWLKIPDEIVKAHYIKKLAEALGVGEDDVRRQMRKIEGGSGGEERKPDVVGEGKSRRERLEEYMVGLAMRGGKLEKLKEPEVGGLIGTGFWKRVVEEAKDKEDGKTISEWIRELPAELRARTQDLMLVEKDLREGEWEKEWDKAVRELEEAVIREKISQLKTQEGGEGEVARLGRRLAELTRDK